MENYSEISEPSDSELLRNWLEGQREAAFRALVRRYSRLALMTARRTCEGDDSLAAEAAQLTFILLARKARELLDCASLGGWVHRTALMQARNLMRTMKREQRKRSQLLQASPGPGAFSAGDRWQALHPVLDQALEALPAKDREALLLRFYRALGVREVGAALGITREAAQKRIDRATEKLRAQILRRGGALAGGTAVSLGQTLAAGFGAEAQAGAALPLATSFAKTALASAGAASSSTGTALFLTSMGMKASSTVAVPLVALLAAGVWFASQRLAIGKLEEENASLAGKMALAGVASKAPAKSRTLPTALDRPPVDWAKVAAALAEKMRPLKGSERYLRDSLALREQILSLSRERLLESLAEVESAKIEKFTLGPLLDALYLSLAEKDPRTALEHSVAKDGADEARYQLLTAWVKQDAAAAEAWVDEQISAGSLIGKQNPDSPEHNSRKAASELFYALLRDHPEAAGRRAAALPANRRGDLLRDQFNTRKLAEEEQVTFATILREHFPDPYPREHIAQAFLGSTLTDKTEILSYAELDAYLKRIEARPDEAAACIQALASAGRFERSGSAHSAPTLKDIETLRAWTAEHAPEAKAKATAYALGSCLSETNFVELAEYALQCRAAGDDDIVFWPFFQGHLQENQVELAQRMIDKTSDGMRRAQFQVDLKRSGMKR